MDRESITKLSRRGLGAGLALLTSAALVGVAAMPAGAATFSNATAITIPGGAPGVTQGVATPYPSAISVAGLTGTITDVNVTVTGLTHTATSDVDVLLVGPAGQNVILQADVMGPTSAVTLTYDDAAATPVPSPPVTGTFRPTGGAFNGTAPAPGGPYGSTLGVFNGTAPNGTWNLFVFDDLLADVGSIAGGWSLNITTNGPTITSFSPASGPAGTPVTIVGTNLSPFTSVTFGGVTASVTSTSATQIVATVPANAVTGPIAVITPTGTATSATNFTVSSLDHSRVVTLSVGHKAKGKVTAPDGFSACAQSVLVKVQIKDHGNWDLVGSDQTAVNGSFTVLGTSDHGKYRALAKKVTLASGDVCLKAVSPVVNH